jgi:hypothetical protein
VNKKFQIMVLLFYSLGLMIFSISSIFRDSLTNFELGFCEGISMVFIVTGVIFMGLCIFKKENPYKI